MTNTTCTRSGSQSTSKAGLLYMTLIYVISLLSGASFAVASDMAKAEPTERIIYAQRGATRDLAPDFLGFNGNLIGHQHPWSDAQLLSAFKRINPGHLRYPGGTVANYWDWDKGTISDRLEKKDMGPSAGLLDKPRLETRYTLEDLAQATRETGATPIFVLNMILYELDEQVAHLKRAQALGMSIKYIELGNEYYFGVGAHPIVTKKYPRAEDYAKAAGRWSRTLKKVFPDVNIAVIAAGPVEDLSKSSRRRTWDKKLYESYREKDAVTLHFYPSTGLAEQGRNSRPEGWGTPQMQRKQANLIATQAGFETLLATSQDVLRKKLANAAFPPDADIWITEFNIWDSTGAIRGTWAHGLAIANFIHTLLSEPRVKLAAYHNVYAQSYFTAIWRSPNEFRYSALGKQDKPEQYALSGPGVALALLGKVMNGSTAATSIIFTNSPSSEPVVLKEDAPRLIGWIFSSSSTENIIFMNLNDDFVMVDVTDLNKTGWGWSEKSAPPRIRVINDGALRVRSGLVDRIIKLSPHSLTLIERN